jgi:hypothetical protein
MDNNGNPLKRGQNVNNNKAKQRRQRTVMPPTRPAQPAQQIRDPPKDPPPVTAPPTSPVAEPQQSRDRAHTPAPPVYFSIDRSPPAATAEPARSQEAKVMLQRRKLGADLVQRAAKLGATDDQLEGALSSGPEEGIRLLRTLIDDLRSKQHFGGGGKKRRYSKKRKYKKKTKRKKSKRKKSKRK